MNTPSQHEGLKAPFPPLSAKDVLRPMGWLPQVLPLQQARVALQQPCVLSLLQMHATSASHVPSSTRSSSRCSDIYCSYSTGLMGIGLCKKSFLEVKKRARVVASAAIKEIKGSILNTEGLRFAVVAGRFNEFVTRPLVAGALETFKAHAVREENIEVVWVPGAFEIPVVAQALASTGEYHAVLCIGTVIRGDTTHYDAVANSAASGILSAGLKSGVPCIFGVLTCETLEQALHRAGGKAGNKGAEAAVTAIEMASLFQHHLRK